MASFNREFVEGMSRDEIISLYEARIEGIEDTMRGSAYVWAREKGVSKDYFEEGDPEAYEYNPYLDGFQYYRFLQDMRMNYYREYDLLKEAGDE